MDEVKEIFKDRTVVESESTFSVNGEKKHVAWSSVDFAKSSEHRFMREKNPDVLFTGGVVYAPATDTHPGKIEISNSIPDNIQALLALCEQLYIEAGDDANHKYLEIEKKVIEVAYPEEKKDYVHARRRLFGALISDFPDDKYLNDVLGYMCSWQETDI